MVIYSWARFWQSSFLSVFCQVFGSTAHAVVLWFGQVLFWLWRRLSIVFATTTREHRVSPSLFSLQLACWASGHAQRKRASRPITWRCAKAQLGCLSKAVSESVWQLGHAHAITGFGCPSPAASAPIASSHVHVWLHWLKLSTAHNTHGGRAHAVIKHLHQFSGRGLHQVKAPRPGLTGGSRGQ